MQTVDVKNTISRSELARMIDHTALKPEATKDQILQLCEEAKAYKLGAVCVAPSWVSLAAKCLEETDTGIATVIGFPHGNSMSVTKAFESAQAVEAGANELDMVINVGRLKSGDHDLVIEDIALVVEAARQRKDVIVKVILEMALLSHHEKTIACQLTERAGADFVKTSTGFSAGGATLDDVRLMRSVVGNRLGIKAAGGIRTLADALEMIEVGATRLGCSSSTEIMEECINKTNDRSSGVA